MANELVECTHNCCELHQGTIKVSKTVQLTRKTYFVAGFITPFQLLRNSQLFPASKCDLQQHQKIQEVHHCVRSQCFGGLVNVAGCLKVSATWQNSAGRRVHLQIVWLHSWSIFKIIMFSQAYLCDKI